MLKPAQVFNLSNPRPIEQKNLLRRPMHSPWHARPELSLRVLLVHGFLLTREASHPGSQL